MKPVIKKQTFYSLLLMRDDSEVRSFRVKNTTLRTFLILFVLLILFGAAGIGVGAHYWKRYASIIDEYLQHEKEIADLRLQLEQLSGMEKIAMASSCPVPLQQNNEVGAEAPARQNNATLPIAISELASPVAGAAVYNATRILFNATAIGPSFVFPQAREAGQANMNATLGTINATLGPEEAGPVIMPPISDKQSPLRINNYSGRLIAQQRLRIKFDLSTAPDIPQDLVTGIARYAVFFANGARVDIGPQSAEDTRFSIRSLKPVSEVLRLPQGYSSKNLKNLEITIELEDGRKFRDLFPIML